MLTNEDRQTIIRFLYNELTPQEMEDFTIRIKTDDEFAVHARIQLEALTIIRAANQMKMNQKRGKLLKPQFYIPVSGAVAALVLAFIFIPGFFKINSTHKNQIIYNTGETRGSAIVPKTSTKTALLVGISEYMPAAKGAWKSIHTENDILLISKTLQDQGYNKDSMIVLQNKQATKEGIEQAFKNLIAISGIGAQVIVHFSSHGQQICDDNGDEADGLDESIACYNSLEMETDTYHGEGHLRDDELGQWIDSIATKVGPTGSVLVTVDACFSGTISRGATGNFRGTDKIFGTDCPKVNHRNGGTDEFLHKEVKQRARVVVISACQANERNEEIKVNGELYGPLSYAIAETMKRITEKTTYESWFDEIKRVMSGSKYQTPSIEGSLNTLVLSGKAVKPRNYFKVSEWVDAQTLRFKLGIPWLTDSSLIKLYTENELSEGYVVGSNASGCMVKLSKPVSKKDALAARCYVEDLGFSGVAKQVRIDPSVGTALKDELKKHLGKIKSLLVSAKDADYIIENKGGDLVLRENNGFVLLRENAGTSEISTIVAQRLEKAIKVANLREIELKDSLISVNCEIVFYKDFINQKLVHEVKLSEMGGNPKNLYYTFKFSNPNPFHIFVTVLNITKEDSLDIFVPEENSELRLEARAENISARGQFKFSEQGKEVFKIIATKENIDLRPFIEDNQNGNRGSLNYAEQFLFKATSPSRSRKLRLTKGNISITSKTVTVP